jgi:osmotically-inducible protein OsmY
MQQRKLMRRFAQAVATLSLIMVSLSGCQTIADKFFVESDKDAAISQDVREALLNDTTTDLTRVRVRTTDGSVDLRGTVPSLEARERAVELAWKAKGVQTVVNHLQVGK